MQQKVPFSLIRCSSSKVAFCSCVEWGWHIYNIVESESDPLTRRAVDLFEKEPLKGNSEVHLHTPTKFGEDRSKDLGGDREQTDRQTNRQTDKRCSIYSMILIFGSIQRETIPYNIFGATKYLFIGKSILFALWNRKRETKGLTLYIINYCAIFHHYHFNKKSCTHQIVVGVKETLTFCSIINTLYVSYAPSYPSSPGPPLYSPWSSPQQVISQYFISLPCELPWQVWLQPVKGKNSWDGSKIKAKEARWKGHEGHISRIIRGK